MKLGRNYMDFFSNVVILAMFCKCSIISNPKVNERMT